MNRKIIFAVSTIGGLLSQSVLAAGYPYTLPSNITASVNVTTSAQETYNNKLLGTNIFDFTSSSDKAFINTMDPITIRFPHGLWANWYDWQTDGTRVYGTDTFQFTLPNGSVRTQTLDHLEQIKLKDTANIKIGIDGLSELNSDRVSSNGKGFDMLWTFNMSEDGADLTNGSPQTIARYNDLISRGFEVKSIELGNENFYPGQRSSIIPTTDAYIKRAKSMSAALKAKDPSIRVSVPLLRRENNANPNWNEDLSADSSYFDAVTVHTYVGTNPDDSSEPEGAYGTALAARHYLAQSVNDYAQVVAPNKPIWLSEWGVKSGGPNAVSVLGMADAYIYMSQNQDVYERANWFSVNGQLNSFFVWETYIAPSGAERPRIKTPLEKTAVGSSYEIIRSVFENSIMLESTMTSPDLMAGVDAVSTRVVIKDGQTIAFVVNLTNKSVPFSINLDGENYNGDFKHTAMSFTWMGQEQVLPFETDPLSTIKEGSGAITLPKFSMSKIVLKDANIPVSSLSVAMTAPGFRTIELGDEVYLKADASSTDSIKQVNFRVNGEFYKQDNTAPYSLTWTPESAGDYTLDAIVVTTDNERKTSAAKTLSVTAPAPSSNFVHLTKVNNVSFSLDGGNGAANGQNVKIWSTQLGNVNQQWEEISRGANYYSYKKRGTQFCIDAGSNGENSQNVELQACDYTSQDQHFQKISHGGNNYQLKKRNATGFSLDGGNGGENGQNAKLWQSQTGSASNQVWTFTSVN